MPLPLLALIAAAAAADPGPVAPVAPPAMRSALPMRVVGRVVRGGTRADPVYRRQWPGTYFETAFAGDAAFFRLGPGEVTVRVTLDGVPVATLARPAPGFYRVAAAPGRHALRLDVVSESQAGPSDFDGFYRAGSTVAVPVPRRARRIEFIGDSHTVGYGNTAAGRTCSEDEIWRTTDTAEGVAGIVARHYGADYEVNAISGRGVVRNYDGSPAETLPAAYPFALFDRATRVRDRGWRPQVIVIALGTNDFSTPLHAGERWSDRAALRVAYEARYTAFVRQVRARHPRAAILLWATTLADGEIAAEAGGVTARLRAAGDRRVGFAIVRDLAFSACNAHPSIADDARVAAAIEAGIDAQPDAWRRP